MLNRLVRLPSVLRRKSQVVDAFLESDIDALLGSAGLLEALQEGSLACGVCGGPVSRENLQCVYTEGGEIRVCCDGVDCLWQALNRPKQAGIEGG